MTFFFRFRSLDALLGERKELEKQEIYFAPPEQLNDPMEGYKDLFWEGDEIAWRNLVKHYLICLMQTTLTGFILGNEYKSTISKNFILSSPMTLPSIDLKNNFRKICDDFFSNAEANEIITLLTRQKFPVRRGELEFCLRGIHPMAFGSIMKVFRRKGLVPPPDNSVPIVGLTVNDVAKSVLKVLNEIGSNAEKYDQEALQALFDAGGIIYKQLDLIRYIGSNHELERAWHSIFYSFPEQYIINLGGLIYFDWYTTCFVGNPTQAAMWGNYGDGHEGVCLKFRAKEIEGNSPTLALRGVIGLNGNGWIYGDRDIPFERMVYTDKLKEIDFFRSIGRLPIPQLKSMWYTDETGKTSNCANDVLSQKQEWHQSYWDSFRTMTLSKLEDWAHEDEYRLRLVSTLGFFQEIKDRKLTYSFQDLEGIIFGIRTPLESKKQIIDVITEKCRKHGREAFEFGQATYKSSTGKITILPLNLPFSKS